MGIGNERYLHFKNPRLWKEKGRVTHVSTKRIIAKVRNGA
jgi:hypothetical protein